MNPTTLAAMRALVLALEEHPEDVAALMVYGHLPEHLADALDDHAQAGEAEDHNPPVR